MKRCKIPVEIGFSSGAHHLLGQRAHHWKWGPVDTNSHLYSLPVATFHAKCFDQCNFHITRVFQNYQHTRRLAGITCRKWLLSIESKLHGLSVLLNLLGSRVSLDTQVFVTVCQGLTSLKSSLTKTNTSAKPKKKRERNCSWDYPSNTFGNTWVISMSKKRAKRYARLKISTQLGLTSGHIFLKFAKSRSKLSEPARDLLHLHNLANKPRASGDSAIMASLIDVGVLPIWLDEGS
mgnify:FL=1